MLPRLPIDDPPPARANAKPGISTSEAAATVAIKLFARFI
jgi:hypothetical protein